MGNEAMDRARLSPTRVPGRCPCPRSRPVVTRPLRPPRAAAAPSLRHEIGDTTDRDGADRGRASHWMDPGGPHDGAPFRARSCRWESPIRSIVTVRGTIALDGEVRLPITCSVSVPGGSSCPQS
ncbi:MAG: hypothetical protein AVDCRST_MAG59-2911 [uncultured Thermomicrobiales bacterium]|uniref:Uncharacterized protein n=1 Tax=uncultured Thermomicrobiales bacterium TaxID=1645740 RepID=A0A6J4V590_9BACT|nr:MAG: hypothetical protein AVDCRST_MAG59-2911 [uncultured Thermomicrobiales bacterium]